jgi:hypothetical protein
VGVVHQPTASQRLPPEVAARLNDAFYRAAPPHQYFELRLISLLAMDALSGDARVEDLPSSTLGEAALGRELEFDPDVLERSSLDEYAAAESQVLLHHASEALLRAFLGHLGFPSCPWLEIASLSNFRVFKERVQEVVSTPRTDLERLVDDYFFGSALDVDTEMRRDFVAVTAETIAAAGHRVLEDAPLYNAAKHGFAVLAGRHLVEWRMEPDPQETPEDRRAREAVSDWLRDEGLTLESLEWRPGDAADGRSWQRALRFVDPDHDVALSWLVIRVLGNVWRVAQARYAGGGEVRICHLDAEEAPSALRDRAKGKGSTMKVPVMALPLPPEQAEEVLARTAGSQADP